MLTNGDLAASAEPQNRTEEVLRARLRLPLPHLSPGKESGGRMVSRCCVPLSLQSVLPLATLLPTWACPYLVCCLCLPSTSFWSDMKGESKRKHAFRIDTCAPGVAIPRLDLTAEKGSWSLPSEDQLTLQVQTRALCHMKTGRGCHALFLLWPCSLCRHHTDCGEGRGCLRPE